MSEGGGLSPSNGKPLINMDVIEDQNYLPSSDNPPRTRVWPIGSAGPYVVYFRSKKDEPLNLMQISRELAKHYPDVIQITKVRAKKLKVVVKTIEQANKIARHDAFTRSYRVYIPAREVEIDGVVTEASLNCEDLLKHGVGCFRDPTLQKVKILDCKQLNSIKIAEDNTKTYSPSGSFRVTFAGSVLPNFILLDRVRLPVRLFVPRVMNCTNCKQLGHTATYCGNKQRCIKCGGDHVDDSCGEKAEKCLYCGENPHELSSCPTYKLRGEKLKRSLKERSKRTFAEMLKNAMPPVESVNLYDCLPSDEIDSDDPQEGTSFAMPSGSRKRKPTSSPKLPCKGPRVSSVGINKVTTRGSASQKPKQKAPGLANLRSDQEFPSLPGTTNTPSTPKIQLENQSSAGLLKFSDIVDWIFRTFNITDPLKSMIMTFMPTVRTFLKQLTATWPLLSVIVSFDG
ncbi:uncharacterized protein LOC131436223 [Malaya genurostris]|uniref:uncharacterized protein LOC131436223 n=1 Tax=Malaya genurostris TaxID=325434 RepID=UPI0026F3E922|nr:uncharacterized protein LOC131436223 [Malaya genurostris]